MTEELKLELTPYSGIATKEGYEKAAIALHDLMAKKGKIEDHFKPKIQAAHETHKAMLELQAMFLGPFLDLEKTIKQDMATWKERQKEIERQEREKFEKLLHDVKTQMESILNEGINELKKNINFDYTEFLSKRVLAVVANSNVSDENRGVVDVMEQDITALLESTRKALIAEQAAKEELGSFEEPFKQPSDPLPQAIHAFDLEAFTPPPVVEQKTKGIAIYKDVEITITDEKLVPIEFAGKIIRPVDLQAIKQLAKVIGPEFKLPGVQVRFIEKIRSTGRF